MPAQITLKAKGLSISPNQLDTQEGSLTQASNVIIKRDNVLESRRGFKLYGTQTATRIKQLFTYKQRILRHFGSTLQFDTEVLNANNESVFSSFSGTFNEVETGLRIKSIESNGNFYFTTADGIKKISAANADQLTTASGFITNAGGVKAINGTARAIYEAGNSTGFLPVNSAVAYRAVWGITDANNNSTLGTPSERIIVYLPLEDFIIPDFNRVLGALDDITDTTTTAFIGDGDYVSTLALPQSSSPIDIQSQIIALAEKIDTDIFIAGDGTNPIDIQGGASVASVTSNIATITKDAGGDFDDYLVAGSKIYLSGFTGAAAVLNGPQTVVTATASDITFNITTANFNQTPIAAGSQIYSYEYRNTIENVNYNNATFNLTTTTINNPATGNQLGILQQAISQIIQRLQDEPVTIITALNQTEFIAPLDITTSANVLLDINIPEDVGVDHFLQLYRSDIAEATGVTILSDLTPNDEMQLVYEAFPTTAELAAGVMTVLDETVDEFAGANLYTNPSTGEGILQGNDVPPLASDINRFKNVVFYANTQTRQRLNFSLLGVQNFNAGNITTVSAGAPATITTDEDHNLTVGQIVYLNGTGSVALDGLLHRVATTPTTTTFTVAASGGAGSSTGYWSNSMIAFVNSSSVRQYYFIKGEAEVTNIATVADVAGSLAGLYFNINSGQDQSLYYVWYEVSGSGTDPLVSGRTGIKVMIATNDSANDVAEKTRNTLARYSQNWSISGATNNIIVTNILEGVTTDATAQTSTFTVTITQQGRGENDTLNEVLLSTAVSPAQAVDDTARSLQNVINRDSSNDYYIYYLSGLADVPGKMLIEGRGLSSSQVTLLANNSDTGDSFDPPISPNPEVTLSNTVANPTVVTATGHGLVSTDNVVIAFSNSTPSISGIHLVTFLSANTYSVDVNVTVAGTTGVMVNQVDSVLSDNERKGNRVYFSKLSQPEAVPLVNYFDVGTEEDPILRIFPLRDSLFVFKADGLFRISGESAPFNLALFDSSCRLIAPDSLGILNNSIFGWADEGIQIITESGIDSISRDIDTEILRLSSANFPNFSTNTWGVGYDSDNSYTVYTNSEFADEVATIGYRYGNLTDSWTTIDKSEVCGIINPADDKMYMGAGDVNYIEQERKSFDRTDYADREIATNLTTNNYFENGSRIKLASVALIEPGDVLLQTQYVTVSNFNALLNKIDLDAGIASVPVSSISTGSTVTIVTKNQSFNPADVNIGTDTITLTSHGYTVNQKIRFLSTGTLPGGLSTNTDYFILAPTTNTFQLSTTSGGPLLDITSIGTGVHTAYRFNNLTAGDVVTLSGTNSDPVIDGQYPVDSIVNPYTFTIIPINPVTTSGTSGIARYSYSENLELSGGQDIRLALTNLASKLDTDPLTQFNNYFDLIDAKSGVITAIGATNPALLTSASHELQDGRYISLTGTNSIPIIDGNYEVTVVNANQFSVPTSVTISGTSGSFSTLINNFNDLLACYNIIIDNLNTDSGTIFNNYSIITNTTSIESLITSVNSFTNEITLEPGINYLIGPLTVYRAIETIVEYCPQTMGDPLGWKHLTNFTMMFENKAFTEAVVSFASDLLPEFIDVPFEGDGNGIFGHTVNFGSGFFGGGSHAAPFRTYFPRQVMRCRFIRIRFSHRIAREKWSIFGITLNGSIGLSDRAYRR